MRFRDRGKQMLAFKKHRHQQRVIRGVRVAEIGVVVQEGVALRQIRMQAAHGLCLQMRAKHMDRRRLGGR